MPDAEGVDPAVRRVVPPQPAMLPDAPASSIETQSRSRSSVASTPSLGSAAPVATGVKRQLSTTPSQQSGNPTPPQAATTEPSGNGAAPVASSDMAMGAPPGADGPWHDTPLADEDEDLPGPYFGALEPLDEHKGDSVFLLSSPPVPPPSYLLDAVQAGQFAWSAGALPSPPRVASSRVPHPIRRDPISAKHATQQCRERDSVSVDLAPLTEHCFHYGIR